MISLLWNYSRRSWRAHLLLSALAFFGLTVSISLYSSIRIANERILGEFQRSVDTLSGSSSLQVRPRVGSLNAERLVPLLDALPEVNSIFPMKKGRASLRTPSGVRLPLWIVGVDVLAKSAFREFSEDTEEEAEERPGSGLLSYSAAIGSEEFQRYEVEGKVEVTAPSGESFFLEVYPANPSAPFLRLFNGRVLLTDLSLADKILGDSGSLSQINIFPAKNLPLELLEERLRAQLPSDVLIGGEEGELHRIAKTSEALRMNLLFLSLLSFFVALLLGYQVIRLITVRRRDDFATLVSLGASPSKLSTLIVAEACVFGSFGGVFGAVLGVLLSAYITPAIKLTISHFYSPLWGTVTAVPFSVLLESVGIGVLVGLLSSLPTSLGVLSVAPRGYFSKVQASRFRRGREVPVLALFGVFSVLGGVFSAEPSFMEINSFTPFLSPLLFCVSVILISPMIVLVVREFGERLSRNSSPMVLLALQSFSGRFRDISIAVSALALSFGMLVGVSTMIESFRESFQGWLGSILQADIFISEDRDSTLSPQQRRDALVWLQKNPLVEDVNSGEEFSYVYRDLKIFLRSSDTRIVEKERSMVFLAPLAPNFEAVRSGEGVFVSEPFANKGKVAVGDSLKLWFGGVERSFRVEAIFQDFSSDLGAVLFDAKVFKELGLEGGRGLGISVYVGHSEDIPNVIEEFEMKFESGFFIRSRRELKAMALRVFDDTFKVTYVLQFLTLLISSLFLVLTVSLSIIERTKEHLTLRSIGAGFSFLSGVIVVEAVLVSLAASILGLALGLVLSWLLVYRINVMFFGWSVNFLLPLTSTGFALIGFLLISGGIGYLVSRATCRNVPLGALRYE